jgi:rhomboid protease GluP
MFRYLREAPVTFASLVVMAAVFAGTHGLVREGDRELWQLRRGWGSVEALTWISTSADRVEVRHPDLYGPFDLWNGQWWRVPVSALHHADFGHLLMNLLGVALLGRMLEQVWGSWRTAVFVVAAAFVTLLPEFLLEHYVLGYSGVACAMLGALIVLRSRYPEVAAQLSDEAVWLSLASLVAMVVLTWLDVLPVANAAHFAGLAYGWLVAQAAARRWPIRGGMIAAHALLILPYWAVVHPTWNGRYHWYRAGFTSTGQLAPREDPALLERAVQCDPTLGGAWLLLAANAERNGQIMDAWGLTLKGLQQQPSDENLWAAARRRWRRLVGTPLRSEAVTILDTIFGEEQSQILTELRRMRPPPVLIAPDRPIGPPAERLAERPAVEPWRPSSPETWRALTRSWPLAPPLDPADPRSAVEGETL